MTGEPEIPDRVTHVLVRGGSFDPPTRVHVEAAVASRAWWNPDALLLFVPASQSPHKAGAPHAGPEDRLAMLRLAIEGVPGAQVSRIEIDRPGPSYTVDTLRLLRTRHPGVREWRLLIGSDQAVQFHRWREPRAVIVLAPPIVVVRPPHRGPEEVLEAVRRIGAWSPEESSLWQSWIAPETPREGSATAVRLALARGERPENDLCPGIMTYITARGLYGFGTAPDSPEAAGGCPPVDGD